MRLPARRRGRTQIAISPRCEPERKRGRQVHADREVLRAGHSEESIGGAVRLELTKGEI